MLKILQARLQQYMNRELSDVQLNLEKGEESDQIANMHWIIKKAKEFQKNIYFCFIDYATHSSIVAWRIPWTEEPGKVVWYSHFLKNFPQFVVIHTVKGFGIVNKTEVDYFLELCLFQ